MRRSSFVVLVAFIALTRISQGQPAFAAGGTPSPYAAAVLSDRPAAYYRLDEYAPGGNVANRTFMTDSAFNNAGYYLSTAPDAITRVRGLTTKDTSGDTAAQFSPNGYAATQNYWQLHVIAMTIEAWVGWKIAPAGVIASFGDAGHAPYDNYKLSIDATTHRIAYQIAVAGTPHIVEAVVPQANISYHVAGTFDGSVQRLYINGVLRSAQLVQGAIGNYNPQSTFGFNVGNDSTHQHPASAVIDEVAIYPHALPAARVAAHYLAGSPLAPYTITALGSGGTDAYVGGLNEAGDVAGAESAFTSKGPAVYTAGRVIQLGPYASFPYAINNHGTVLLDRGNDGLYRCSVTTLTCAHLKPLPLPCPENNVPYIAPGALNDLDTVVAYENNALCSGPVAVTAAAWDAAGNARRIFAPAAATYSEAQAVNDAGTILGGITSSATFSFAPVLAMNGAPRRVGFLHFPTTLKNNGDILGSIYAGCAYGIVRRDGYAFAVPIVPSTLVTTLAMNSLDQVVGFGQLPRCVADNIGSVSMAGETQQIPLSTLVAAGAGWTNLNPVAINDRGQIAGTGVFAGLQHIFLMSPNPR